MWPEIWQAMGKKQKAREIAKCEALQHKLKAARDNRGMREIPADDKDYLKILSEVRAKLSVPPAPAMPLFSNVSASFSSGRPDAFETAVASLQSLGRPDALQTAGAERQHQDHTADKGPSENWFGLVRTPVPIPKALKIPEAREALGKEWKKLEDNNA